MALAAKGLGRQEAHKLVRDAAQTARAKALNLQEALLSDPKVAKIIGKKELDAAMDPAAYLGQSAAIVDAIVKRVR
jgi:adenylosuccinate lyase